MMVVVKVGAAVVGATVGASVVGDAVVSYVGATVSAIVVVEGALVEKSLGDVGSAVGLGKIDVVGSCTGSGDSVATSSLVVVGVVVVAVFDKELS